MLGIVTWGIVALKDKLVAKTSRNFFESAADTMIDHIKEQNVISKFRYNNLLVYMI